VSDEGVVKVVCVLKRSSALIPALHKRAPVSQPRSMLCTSAGVPLSHIHSPSQPPLRSAGGTVMLLPKVGIVHLVGGFSAPCQDISNFPAAPSEQSPQTFQDKYGTKHKQRSSTTAARQVHGIAGGSSSIATMENHQPKNLPTPGVSWSQIFPELIANAVILLSRHGL